jgi:hypothetical protein
MLLSLLRVRPEQSYTGIVNQGTKIDYCAHWLPLLGCEPVIISLSLSIQCTHEGICVFCQSHMCVIGQMSFTLRILFLGSTPYECIVESWINMEYLCMDHNLFTGAIPASLWSLEHIYGLSLLNNNLTGSASRQLCGKDMYYHRLDSSI